MLRLVSIAGLLLMVFTILAIAVQATEVSVSFSQDGTSSESLDVNKSLTYNVNVSGATNSNRYTVTLTTGPDQSNPSVSFSDAKSVNIDSGASNIAQFTVNFMDSEFRNGEFAKWVGDANRTEEWSGAWWKVDITDLNPFTPDIHESDYSGHPKLVKPVWLLKEASVTPSQGTNAETYTYEVQIFATSEDSLKLEAAPSREGNWTSFGEKIYTTPGSWQILTWSNITLPFEFGAAAYRLTGRKQQTFDGPFWPVEIDFKNASVTPPGGTPERRFDYSLEMIASRPIDVDLNALDVGTGKYKSIGKAEYKNATLWEKLKWDNVRLASREDSLGTSNFYFSFHYPGSEASFDTTQKRIGKYFVGPNLSTVVIEGSVMPDNGTIYTPFTYSAKVNTTMPSCNIMLEIKPPSSDVWIGQGRQDYTADKYVMMWPNLSFRASPEVLGMGRYRFLIGDVVLQEFEGPEIDVAIRNESFKRVGSRFDYSAEVRSARRQVEMELLYTDDGVKWIQSGMNATYISDMQEWTTLVWKNQPWHKSIRVDEMRREE